MNTARTAALAVVVTLFTLLPAAPALASPTGTRAEIRTDRLLFDTPIDEFLSTRADESYGLDWSSDDCSAPVLREPERSRPYGFDFRGACERHDFGYRNYRAQDRLTEDSRKKIDDTFLADMNDVCDGVTGWLGLKKRWCRKVASDYHFWVRSCGANPAPFCPEAVRDRFEQYPRG